MRKLKWAISIILFGLIISLSSCGQKKDRLNTSDLDLESFENWVTKVGAFGKYMTDYKDIVIVVEQEDDNFNFYEYLNFWDISRFPIEEKPHKIDENIYTANNNYIRIVEYNNKKYILASQTLDELDLLYEKIAQK